MLSCATEVAVGTGGVLPLPPLVVGEVQLKLPLAQREVQLIVVQGRHLNLTQLNKLRSATAPTIPPTTPAV